ncbi:MAG: M1 family metallopeptidase [Bacteroidota bacterium]
MRIVLNSVFIVWYLLSANTTLAYTHADTLRGSNGRGRAWWDVQLYDLHVAIDTSTETIRGTNEITLKVTGQPADSMQIDLQGQLVLQSADVFDEINTLGDKPSPLPAKLTSDPAVMKGLQERRLEIVKEGNVWWLKGNFHKWKPGSIHKIRLQYDGTPRVAVNAPWDGGFTWSHDSLGRAWISVSCQGLGASAWWPCKDAQWDEPDSGAAISLTVPARMKAVSNGRLVAVDTTWKDVATWQWRVENPINNYDISFYLGDYVHWHDTLMGEKGKLDLDYWVLSYNETRAKKHFAHVKEMVHCFEYWLGPYPFYEDGYKLVESPYLGMEHQSAVAYGNGYKMGYLGHDRTGTGIGLTFDYITVHESAHEWFGNNITAKDIADMWVQEGITTYSESLYAECIHGKEKGQKYCRGEWMNVQNDKPIIGRYGINEEGSGDMYDKGAAIMHMIRTMTGNDEKFRAMLRGLGRDFYHSTVTTQEVENYIAQKTSLELGAFFNQYLRTTNIPELEYYIKENELFYKFNNTVPGFSLPLTLSGSGQTAIVKPAAEWQHIKWTGGYNVSVAKDYLVVVKN